MGPKKPFSTVLSRIQEALIVTFRKHTLFALDDCLYTRQDVIPHLSRSSLHRCLQRHGISRLPAAENKPSRKLFKSYQIGFFHIDITEVRTEEGKLYLCVAIDPTLRYVMAMLVPQVNMASVIDGLPCSGDTHLIGFARNTALNIG